MLVPTCRRKFGRRTNSVDVRGRSRERKHAGRVARLSGWHSHHRQPVHPAGSAVRLRARRPLVLAQHRADVARDGGDVRRGRHLGGGRGRLGGAGQRVRANGRARSSRGVRSCAAVSAPRRPSGAPVGGHRRPSVAIGRGRAGRLALFCARHRGRSVVGTLRGADPRPDPDRGGIGGRECHHHPAACRLCGRGRDLARVRYFCRRPYFCGDEIFARRRGVAAPRTRRCGPGRRHRDCARPRYRIADAAIPAEHGRAGAAPDRCGAAAALRCGRQHDDVDAGQSRHDGGRRRPCRFAGRGDAAAPVRRGRLAELAAADPGGLARQGRSGRFLDLFLHQLPARCPT
jgi:hypothetical protein